ncbi:MATE family efflux transporter [Peptacetobacter hominis]|uniref:Multidrug export protein MepA n=1 Tax=Peptacetobacter hominis TaxID=2743610 RepID=A0A544QXN9_9FIRM|nr:MATE family efflux transporter [Peptacetobacter hominis]TQQ85421.1 MATE family efflux transporter [Peptacetobacter hominis]
MNAKIKKIELLDSAPITKALLVMGIPTMIGMLINALYNIVDAYFISGLGNSQMGAISVIYPLGQVIVGLGLLFGNGAGSYISRLLGQKNKDKANNTASTAVYGSLLVGSFIIIISLLFLKPLLIFLGATDSILPYAIVYSRIYILSCIFNIFNVTMNNIVTSEGSAKTTMFALLIGAFSNIILDPIFIYKFNMGVSGAAIATAISQIITTSIYLNYIKKNKSIFNFKIRDCKFSKDILSEIFKIGVPTLIFQLFTSISISLVNNASSIYGDSVIAGMGIVTRLVSIGSLTVFGFIKGFQPIAGYNYGAKNFSRLKESIKISIIWSTIFCIITGLIFIIFNKNIVSLFSNGNTMMINISSKALRANGFTFMFFGFYTVYSSLFLALGKGKEGFFLGACRQGICFIPIILIFPHILGIDGILYSQPIADIISVVITVLMALALNKNINSSENNL